MNWVQEVVEGHFAQLVEVRRHLHQNPELGHKEFETADYLRRQIADFGVGEIRRPAPTSLCVTFGPRTGGAIAFRADIDALPIQEKNELSYKSHKSGVMHACGHDVHAAIVLALIPVLLRAESRLRRPVKLIFQQAEEVVPGGASSLIEGGVLEDPTVCEMYGIHMWPHLELGRIGIRHGPVMGSLDGITISIRSGEETDTHERAGGTDAIRIAATLLNELAKAFGGREISDSKPAALLIGLVSGGTAPSRFARTAVIKGALRALQSESRARALEDIQSIIDCVTRKTAGEITLDLLPYIRPHVINSDSCLDRVQGAAAQTPECEVNHLEHPLSCSDDFGCYLENVPGALVLLGSRTGDDTAHPLHTPRFNVDERVIKIGATLLGNIALDFAA